MRILPAASVVMTAFALAGCPGGGDLPDARRFTDANRADAAPSPDTGSIDAATPPGPDGGGPDARGFADADRGDAAPSADTGASLDAATRDAPPGPDGGVPDARAVDAPPLTDGGSPGSSGQPRLLAPSSTTTLVSRTLDLRWAEVADASGGYVWEVCSDRGCGTRLFSASAAVGVTTARYEVPAGHDAVFFRVQAVTVAGVRSPWSSTWEVFVPTSPSPGTGQNLLWLDFDGSGSRDLVVARTERAGCACPSPTVCTTECGGATFYVGTYAMMGPTAVHLASEPRGVGATGVVSLAGDVNGDGFGDLIIGSRLGGTTRANLWLGRAPRGSWGPPLRAAGAEVFGTSFAGLGDVDGDGYGDVATLRGTNVEILRGGPNVGSIPFGAPWFTFTTTGTRVTHVGDVDGDGRTDLVLTGGATAELHRGTATGFSTGMPLMGTAAADVALATGDWGWSPAFHPPTDGRADFIVGGRAFFFPTVPAMHTNAVGGLVAPATCAPLFTRVRAGFVEAVSGPSTRSLGPSSATGVLRFRDHYFDRDQLILLEADQVRIVECDLREITTISTQGGFTFPDSIAGAG